jgi:hypothetical protein
MFAAEIRKKRVAHLRSFARVEDLVDMDWGQEFIAARDRPFSLSAIAR